MMNWKSHWQQAVYAPAKPRNLRGKISLHCWRSERNGQGVVDDGQYLLKERIGRREARTMIQASPFQLAQKTIPKIIMAAVAAFPPATVLADRAVPAAVEGLAILMKAP